MGDPKDASLSGEGFRFYRWTDAVTGEETDVLSVTSIRRLCGEPYNLVAWQLANIADAALGTMKRTVIGPRGGVSEKRQLWQYPSEFVEKYDATKGEQAAIDELRKWLREQADSPRNVAAMRGTMVHEAIERNVKWDRIEMPYLLSAFDRMSASDKRRMNRGVDDEDVTFVRNAVRHYWDLREKVPFVIVARELQVFNLTAGYAGSFDALLWVLPEGVDPRVLPKADVLTAADVQKYGGRIVLADWKTSKDVHTDQVVQAHAYMSAEFVGTGGVKDDRLTDLLLGSMTGALVHIRPDGWGFHEFDWEPEVVRAFLGSVAFARFLAKHPRPDELFARTRSGHSTEEEA